MSVVTTFKTPIASVAQPDLSHGLVGQLVAINEQGQPLVCFGQGSEPSVARSLLSDNTLDTSALPLRVFLVFEQGDPSKPIISGLLNDKPFTNKTPPEPATPDRELMVNGKRLNISAQDEILLRCGKSSILLRRDGKIVIKGENLVSRSASANKIKGASVSIN